MSQSVTERQVLHDSTYEEPGAVTFIKTESRMVVTRTDGREGWPIVV